MTGSPEYKDFADIVMDMYLLTNQMMEQRHQPDFLIEAVEKRQAMMDQYDRLAKQDPYRRKAYEQDPKAKDTIRKIIEMDQTIARSLESHKASVHNNIANVVSQQKAQKKVLDYLGGPRSGSRMDYRE